MQEYAKDNKSVFQLEVWKECNGQCEFCYLSEEVKKISTEAKIHILNNTIDLLTNLDLNLYNSIGFIGGEFFQGQLHDPEVKALFKQVINIIIEKLRKREILQFWVTASLLTKDQTDLWETLDMFKEVQLDPTQSVWVCTSWDIKGRFIVPSMRENWENNLLRIHNDYEGIVHTNVTLISTKWLCEAYLNDEFSFSEMRDKFNTTVFMKNPAPINLQFDPNKPLVDMGRELRGYRNQVAVTEAKFPGMFPPRDLFLRTITKIIEQDLWLMPNVINVVKRADFLLRLDKETNDFYMAEHRRKDKLHEVETISQNPVCKRGHNITYASYLDSERCMVCDRNKLYENLTGLPHEFIYGGKQ